MDRYKETFETWNKIASLYEDKFMDLDIYNETYDFICNSIVENKSKILEIGCGPGNITKYLLSKRPDFNILGIDISENMVELARRNNPGAIFQIMDSRNIGDLNTKFNGIVCGFCLPYLSQSDCTELISDSYNLLIERGLFYLSFVEGDPKESGFQIGSSGDRSYFYYHNLETVKTQLEYKGFDSLKIFKVEYAKSNSESLQGTHTIIVARKKTLVETIQDQEKDSIL